MNDSFTKVYCGDDFSSRLVLMEGLEFSISEASPVILLSCWLGQDSPKRLCLSEIVGSASSLFWKRTVIVLKDLLKNAVIKKETFISLNYFL